MCKAFEDERLEGRLEGERIGEENLRQAIKNLMKNLKLTSIQALEVLGIPQNEWEKYKQVQLSIDNITFISLLYILGKRRRKGECI